jgi:quercetin dioxygenase-like cupin family protein
MTYMSNELVPGSPLHVDLSWIYAIPEPNPHILEHTHDYDKIVLYIGGNPYHPEDLGAEIEYYLGGQSFTLNVTSAIYVPKGVKHGPLTWKKVSSPCLEMTIALLKGGTGKTKTGLTHKKGDTNYEKYVIREPVYRENVRTIQGPLGPVMLYMCNDLLPESNIYIDYLWMFGVPEPHIFEHSHDYDEVVLHIGGNPYDHEDLGAEVKFCVGGQPLVFNQTTAIYIPKGIKHGPLTWNKVDRPHIQMPIVLGAGTLDEAAPAGYKGDQPFFKNVS